MFTGIVTAVGRVRDRRAGDGNLVLWIEAPYADLQLGESVAVSGVCLTVVAMQDGAFRVDAITTTRGRTRLADLAVGDRVNLERALAVGDRLGGHFVQGHVDGLAEVRAVRDVADARLVDLALPDDVAAVTILHGSVAVDGVSLTVNAMPEPGTAQVALIPFTRAQTTLGALTPGDHVHVEGDMLGKFTRQLLGRGSPVGEGDV